MTAEWADTVAWAWIIATASCEMDCLASEDIPIDFESDLQRKFGEEEAGLVTGHVGFSRWGHF
jgi:hypothetical protein